MKLFTLITMFAVSLSVVVAKPVKKEKVRKKRILMIVAPVNFRDEELFVPEKMFKAAGMDVVIASTVTSTIRGMLKGEVRPDITLDDVYAKHYDAIVFVGGIGVRLFYKDKHIWKIAKNAINTGKIVGAICLAPNILAEAGLLKGKKATCWNSDIFIRKGINNLKKPVIVDGNIITANGPKAAKEFATAIINALNKKAGRKQAEKRE